jgi:3-methyladenine DNA glycosylase/8-oxoguanine DNA glycosylase
VPAAARVVVRATAAPRWPLRLPGPGTDGVLRRRPRAWPALERLLHVDGAPVVVGVEQPAAGRLDFDAAGPTEEHAARAIARMRFALGVDDDLRDFHARFRDDPLIGPSVRADPGLRVTRTPDPFQALVWAICEQLIEYRRAVGIERSILRAWGRTDPETGLRDLPSAATLAGLAPAQLQAHDLSGGRARALVRAAHEVARGRVVLDPGSPEVEHGWRRLRTIPGIGAWTVEVLALHGQGRHDQLPAGDLAYLKLVGRLQTGDPRARVLEEDVRAFFAPYAPYGGLAGAHALRGAGRRGMGVALRGAA